MKFTKTITRILCLIMLFGCFGGINIISADTSLTVSISPTEDNTIFVSDSIVLTFNNQMDEGTLANVLIEKLNAAGVGTAVEYSVENGSFGYVFQASLEYNSRYKITVPTTVKDIIGNTLPNAVVRTFNTFSKYYRGIKTMVLNETYDQYNTEIIPNDSSDFLYNVTTNPLAFGRYLTSGTSPSVLKVVNSTDENNQQSNMLNAVYGTNYYQPIYGGVNTSKLVGKNRVVLSFKCKVSNVITTPSTFYELHLRVCDLNTAIAATNPDKYLARMSVQSKKLYLFGGTSTGTGLQVTVVPTDWTTVEMELDTSGAYPVSKYALVNGTLVPDSINRNISDSMYSLANFTSTAGRISFQNSGNGTVAVPINWYIDDVMIYEPEALETLIMTESSINGLGVDVNTNSVKLKFNNQIDSSTLSSLRIKEEGIDITGNATLLADGKTCEVQINKSNLTLDKDYTIEVESSLKDIFGQTAQNDVVNFSTKNFAISNFVITDANAIPLSGQINAGSIVKASAVASHTGANDKNLTLVLLVFKGSELVGLAHNEVVVSSGESGKTIATEYLVPDGYSNCSVRAFIIDNFTDLNVLTNVLEYN